MLTLSFVFLQNWPPEVSADISFSLLNKNKEIHDSNQSSSSKVEQPNNISSQLQEKISVFGFFVNLLENAVRTLHISLGKYMCSNAAVACAVVVVDCLMVLGCYVLLLRC